MTKINVALSKEEILSGAYRTMTPDKKKAAASNDAKAITEWLFEEVFEAVEAWLKAGNQSSDEFDSEMLDVIGLMIVFNQIDQAHTIASILTYYDVSNIEIATDAAVTLWLQKQKSKGRTVLDAGDLIKVGKTIMSALK